MRSFFVFVGLIVASLIVAAALTYPAWQLVGLISIEPVHRVMHRVAMLFALIGLVVLTRRLLLSDRASLGYGLPARTFLRQYAVGWLLGVALMLPLVSLLLGFEVRLVRDADGLVSVIATGIISGIVVALIEETFFRGVLYTAVARTSGVVAAIVAPSLLYAAVHFLGGRLRVPPEEVTWGHGFAVLAKLFERYLDPLSLIDSFLALFVLGVLLSLVRLRTGAIAAGMGLHAAGVAGIALLRALTFVDPNARYGNLVGNYDGVIGWAAFVWFAIIALAYALLTRRRS